MESRIYKILEDNENGAINGLQDIHETENIYTSGSLISSWWVREAVALVC